MKTLRNLIMMMVAMIAMQQVMNAQTRTSKGVVVDEENVPLVGAIVTIKGTTKSVAVDFNGFYKIKTNENDKLIVSFIGCKSKEIKALDSSYVVLYMESTEIGIVEVKGYLPIKTSKLSESIDVFGGKELTKFASSSVSNSLQGKTPGLMITKNSGRPGAASTFRMRGIGSMNAGSDPLFVIDGVPISSVEGSDPLSDISPSDIESVNILKDAAACAIYGCRGANGVVMIYTKRGINATTVQEIDTDPYPLEILYNLVSSGVKKLFCKNC